MRMLITHRNVIELSFLIVALMAMASVSSAADTNAPGEISQEAKTNFEWFSNLGFPDLQGCPFVRVATGRWFQSGNEPRQNQYVDGFLLASNAINFTVFTMDLFKNTLAYCTNGAPEYARVAFEPAALQDTVNAVLTNHLNEGVEQNMMRRFGAAVSERVEYFALAWACWRNGLNSDAEKLFQRAKLVTRGNEPPGDSVFHTKLEKDIAYGMMWRAVLGFGTPSVSRPQLLAEFEAIATNYPNSEYEQRAKDTVGILTRMVAEDAAHAKVAPTNLDLLTVEDRVRELIFQLRDQNGQQWSQPGSCDIFLDPRGSNSPAAQLVSIGYPAVPQLIPALDNPTFTRSISFWRNFAFSHTVLTVGDCAEAILEKISGQSFYRAASTSGYMSNENKNAPTRKAVEAWWAEFQKKGEEQMLIEGTEAGDENAPSQAEILVEHYPKTALKPLIKGTAEATNEWVKARMVQLFEKFDSPEALVFLDKIMREGTASPSVIAAEILNRKGKHEAIDVMIQKWKDAKTTDEIGSLAGFLANLDSPEAIEALGQNLAGHSIRDRMGIVNVVGESGTWAGDPSATNRSAATLEAVETLLVAELQDEGQVMGDGGIRMNKRYVDPRVCDFAGLFLNLHWPERYDFDLEASLKVRDKQRVECQNVWRRSHNLALISLPPSPTNHVATNEATKVAEIEWETNTVKPSGAFTARIEPLKNCLLSATNVVNLLIGYASEPEQGTSGLIFQMRKDEDMTGVKLSFCLLPGTVRNPRDDWEFTESATLGPKVIERRAGGIWATEARSWEDLTNTIDTVIAAAPETPFVINVKLYSRTN